MAPTAKTGDPAGRVPEQAPPTPVNDNTTNEQRACDLIDAMNAEEAARVAAADPTTETPVEPVEGEEIVEPEAKVDDKTKDPKDAKETDTEKAAKEIATARARLAELDVKWRNKFAMVQRKEQTLAKREAELEATYNAKVEERVKAAVAAKERELSESMDVDDLIGWVERKAKKLGTTPDAVWRDNIELIRNGGRRTPEMEAAYANRRELQRIREEREAEKLEREAERSVAAKRQEEETAKQRAAEAAAQNEQTESAWQQATVELAKEESDRWPMVAQLHPMFIGAASLRVTQIYYTKTGLVPSQEEILDYLESQVAATKAPAASASNERAPAAASPKGGVAPKAKTPTNKDSASAPIDLRKLSESERMALATKQLEAHLRA